MVEGGHVAGLLAGWDESVGLVALELATLFPVSGWVSGDRGLGTESDLPRKHILSFFTGNMVLWGSQSFVESRGNSVTGRWGIILACARGGDLGCMLVQGIGRTSRGLADFG